MMHALVLAWRLRFTRDRHATPFHRPKKLVGAAAFSPVIYRIASSFNFGESARQCHHPPSPNPASAFPFFYSLFVNLPVGRAQNARRTPPSLLRPLKDEGARHDCRSDAPGEIEVEASGARQR